MNLFYQGDEEKLGANIKNGINAKMNVNPEIYGKEARTLIFKICLMMMEKGIKLNSSNFVD